MQDVSDAQFNAEVLESERPVLVDFWAPWCGPCLRIAPILEELAVERPDLKIVKVNIDENPQQAGALGVLSIPTLVLFRFGAEVARITGAVPKAKIVEQVDRAL